MAVQQVDRPENLDDRKLAELWSRMTTDIGQLLKRETDLAKAEIAEQVGHVSKASAMFAATGVVGFVALLLLSIAAAWGLAELMAPGLAFAIVGAVFVLVAVVLLSKAKKHMSLFQPLPKQTLDTIKQDISVAKESFNRGATRPS